MIGNKRNYNNNNYIKVVLSYTEHNPSVVIPIDFITIPVEIR